jgi:AcrR family transcriptional regulator
MFENGNRDGAHERSLSPSAPSTALVSPPRGDPRRLILDAIVKTVARRGYDRTTVSRIVREAGVAEALFSEHFHDKQDCFMQAVDELLGGVERRALEQWERPLAWAERVRSGLGTLLEGLAGDADRARVTFVEMLMAGPRARERQCRALALFTSLVEEGRQHAVHSCHLPEQTSEAVVGGIASILHRRILEGETARLPSLHSDLTYFALLPYLDQEEAAAAAGLT